MSQMFPHIICMHTVHVVLSKINNKYNLKKQYKFLINNFMIKNLPLGDYYVVAMVIAQLKISILLYSHVYYAARWRCMAENR